MVNLEKRPIWKSHRKELLIIFLGTLLASFILLYIFNAVPIELQSSFSNTPKKESPIQNIVKAETVLPRHIRIPKIGVDVLISNPESDSVPVLDDYLTRGSVRYPGSGSLTSGNMFLFAHSTGIKIVQNQAYKAFNNLQSLSTGDVISVSGEDGKTYLYKVATVKLATDKDVLVRFDKSDRMLTLSTCNTFGQKSERYVVEAYFDRVE